MSYTTDREVQVHSVTRSLHAPPFGTWTASTPHPISRAKEQEHPHELPDLAGIYNSIAPMMTTRAHRLFHSQFTVKALRTILLKL